MPEFLLNLPPTEREINTAVAHYGAKPRKVHAFYDLNMFARGYVEAMFFTNGDCGDDRESLLNDWGVEKLTRASVDKIRKDCAAFEQAAADLLALAYSTDAYDIEQAGRDFWFARQGHGVGFWGRKALDRYVFQHANASKHFEPDAFNAKYDDHLGRLLAEKARNAGECYVEAYRGWIHVR